MGLLRPEWAPPDAARVARTLAVGQAVSFLLAASGVFSGLLAERGVVVPSAQSALNYWALFLVYGGYRVVRAYRQRKAGAPSDVDGGGGVRGSARAVAAAVAAGLAPSTSWWRYALIAACDVEANYMLVEAYEYTSVTSIMLIDCWSIVVAMALSATLLRRRFGWRHGAGVALCVGGLAVLAASDAGLWSGGTDGGSGASGGGGNATLATAAATNVADVAAAAVSLPTRRPRSLLASLLLPSRRAPRLGDADGGLAVDPLLGDALVLGAASLFAASNVGEEALLHSSGGSSGGASADRSEFLAQLGGWGAVLITVQLLAAERHELAALLTGGGSDQGATASPAQVAGLLLGFAACQFGTYSLTAVFLSQCDATLFNLSLLTSDGWAILASLALFGQPIRPLYWPALVLIVGGLSAYNAGGPPGVAGGGGSRERLGDGDGDSGGGEEAALLLAPAAARLLSLEAAVPVPASAPRGWPAKSGPTRSGASTAQAAAGAAAPPSSRSYGALVTADR